MTLRINDLSALCWNLRNKANRIAIIADNYVKDLKNVENNDNILLETAGEVDELSTELYQLLEERVDKKALAVKYMKKAQTLLEQLESDDEELDCLSTLVSAIEETENS